VGYDPVVFGRSIVLVAAACVVAGCSDKTHTLTCASTIATACADPANQCVLTWADAQTDTMFCPGATEASPVRVECGAYHAVSVKVGSDNRTYYYDAGHADGSSSGALIAIVTAHSAAAKTTCDAGPAAGFTLPSCSGMGSEPLPQCLDGGAD